MERAILNHLSTNAIVVIFVGGMALLAITGVLLVRRAFPNLADSRFEDVADSLRVVYELIFALILAFVIAAVLEAMSEAEATVATEATTISQLVRNNESLPTADRLQANDALDDYVHAVADDEWTAMRDGEESPLATAALESVYARYRDADPRGTVQEESYSLALSKLDDVAAERRERLNIAAADLPTMLRLLVVIGIVLLLVLEYRPGLSRGASLVFMGFLAAIVTSAYLLTLVLNYPFAGSISVSSDPLKEDRLALFWDDELQYERKDGDERVALKPADLRGMWNSNAFGTLIMRCYPRGDGPDASERRSPEAKDCRHTDDWYGVYRYNDGYVTGRLADDGVFRGVWQERPEMIADKKSGVDVGAGGVRPKVDNSGAFAWRGVRRSGELIIVGCWIYGADGRDDPEESFKPHPGWDLERIGDGVEQPADLADRFGSFEFRSAPRVPRTPRPVHDCARRAL